MNANTVVHWVIIECYKKYGDGNLVEYLKWDRMRFETRCKWAWYFRYREALLQCKYPKFHVTMRWGNEPAQGKTKEQINRSLAIAKKRKISEYTNKINLAKKNWNYLFPIEEDINYIKAIAKIQKLKNELKELEP